MKKLIAGIAAVVAMSAFASTASAVDWSAAGHADGDDPATGTIISTDENGVTWGQATAGELSKFRITWADVLENPDDFDRVYEGSWKITYHGLSKFTGTETGWMGGGAWISQGNSDQYSLAPDEWDEDGKPVWKDEQTVEDHFKWLLGAPKEKGLENEIVFMDWSGQDITDQSITFTVSDFKIFDKEGNEIPQKAYGGSSAAAEEAPAEEAAAEEAPAEEAAAEEAPAEEAAPAETEAAPAPAAAEETTSTATGNTSAAAAVAVMAAAAVAAYVSKKK